MCWLALAEVAATGQGQQSKAASLPKSFCIAQIIGACDSRFKITEDTLHSRRLDTTDHLRCRHGSLEDRTLHRSRDPQSVEQFSNDKR